MLPGKRHSGFSMVELSVVMVVIGLLAVVVTAGGNILKNTEKQQIIMEITSHISNVKVFFEKYGYYPGDMPIASDFWFNATTCPAGQVPAGCNGDGDGKIGPVNSGSENLERYRAWQHMVFADIMKGSFTGLGIGGVDLGDATNSPISIKKNVYYYLTWDSYNNSFPTQRNLLCTYDIANVALTYTPKELYHIDKKIDDGLPRAGGMISFGVNGSVAGNCYVNSGGTKVYKLTYTGIACRTCVDIKY